MTAMEYKNQLTRLMEKNIPAPLKSVCPNWSYAARFLPSLRTYKDDQLKFV